MTERTLDVHDLAGLPRERVGELRTPELFALAAGRLWVSEFLRQGDEAAVKRPCWRAGFAAADLDDRALTAFDQLFQAFAAGATRQIEFHCPNCPRLSADERRYLEALALLQRDRHPPAEAILGDWLAPAARRIALNAAQVVALSMAEAGLILPWCGAETALPKGLISYPDQGFRLVH